MKHLCTVLECTVSHKDRKYDEKTEYVSNNCSLFDVNGSIVCQATSTFASDHVGLHL